MSSAYLSQTGLKRLFYATALDHGLIARRIVKLIKTETRQTDRQTDTEQFKTSAVLKWIYVVNGIMSKASKKQKGKTLLTGCKL